MRIFLRYCKYLFVLGFFSVLVVLGAGVVGFWHYGRDLPDHKQLAEYKPSTVTRVHAGDGRLIAEYAKERRVFVPAAAMPLRVKQAFIAAEDQNYYSHNGIDFKALFRASVTNVINFAKGRRPVGASTITQQVAKNFLLTNEVSIERKFKEAILAIRIERALKKDRILELYLNEIYLGYGSYGVAHAALNYFNKSMDELTTAEVAFLAALPKAPNNYHPVQKRKAATDRRNWVIGRMLEEGFIKPDIARIARREPLDVVSPDATQFVVADYFVEEVRRELIERFNEDELYEGGLSVRTTLDPRLQSIADQALRRGLIAYDRRHGWRGPVTTITVDENWLGRLRLIKPPTGIGSWQLAVVLSTTNKAVGLGLVSGQTGAIPLSELKWARAWRKKQSRGPAIRKASDVLKMGDVVMVHPLSEPKAKGKRPHHKSKRRQYGLRQIPDIQGGIVALDPHTGRVLAMSGGYDFALSEFNRATQAKRQPGSAIKPFVYLAALEKGYKPTTLILDAPFVLKKGSDGRKWKPKNYTMKFYGPSPLRLGIEKSRNLMTVRLARKIGMKTVSNYAKSFGIDSNMPKELSMALGAGETTLLRMTAAYGMLVNGGKRISPTFIDRIQDRTGKTVFRHDTRKCAKCRKASNRPPRLPDLRKRVADRVSAYQMVSMLKGVVQRGTAQIIRSVGKPLAGKSGTSNQAKDTWFVGFAPDMAVGVWAGFDMPRTLGRRETGSSVSAPIFKGFMARALKGKPAVPFRVPPGVRLRRVNPFTGCPAAPDDKKFVLEAFRSGSKLGVCRPPGSDRFSPMDKFSPGGKY